MKFTVLESKCLYDKEHGTTTYSMTIVLKPGSVNIGDPAIQTILKRLGFSPLGVMIAKGYAHLKYPDTWNDQIGKRVAEAKCHRRIFYKMADLNVEVAQTINTEIMGKKGDFNKYFYALDNEQSHIKTLCQ